MQAQQRARIAALKKPLLAKLSKIEKEMARLTELVNGLDAKISDPDWYAAAQSEEIARITRERGEAASSLSEAEAQWLETSEAIEACDSQELAQQ